MEIFRNTLNYLMLYSFIDWVIDFNVMSNR